MHELPDIIISNQQLQLDSIIHVLLNADEVT